jgi:hypothetical protein
VVLFSLSLIKKLPVRLYGLCLSGIGALIAAYHYGVQRFNFLTGTAGCSIETPCSVMYLGYWGFYSIPLMALTAFVAIIVVLLFTRKA